MRYGMDRNESAARAISLRARLLGSLGAGIALAGFAAPAMAQVAADSDGEAAAAEKDIDIVVTGTRITSSGFSAPTPTTVISVEQLQQSAQPNIFDSIAQLPALQGSVGTGNSRNNLGIRRPQRQA